MSDLIRLVYASQSINDQIRGSIDPVVGGILAQSRRNNSRSQISGVLYYGDGFFFQCLEGEKSVVEETYARIRSDKRHRHARIIRLQGISERLFSDWSMKYVPAEKEVRQFLRQEGIDLFNPFRFEEAVIDRLLLFFHRSEEPEALAEKPAGSSGRGGFWKRLTGTLGLRESA